MATKILTTRLTDDYFALVQQFPLIPIRDERHLKAAHAMIDQLSAIPEDELTSGQMDYLLVLGDLADAYESKLMAEELEPVTGLDLLKHLVREQNWTASDLGRLLGQRELGSKILRGQRQISKSHAKKLGEHFSLPGEMFLR